MAKKEKNNKKDDRNTKDRIIKIILIIIIILLLLRNCSLVKKKGKGDSNKVNIIDITSNDKCKPDSNMIDCLQDEDNSKCLVPNFIGKNKRGQGYGGGVCQVSSTLYQAALETGCKIIERHEHSQPVSYCKKGKDATVTYGANNLIFKNTNKFSIKLVTYAEEGRTTCVVYRID